MMKRRSFIKKSSVAATAMAIYPGCSSILNGGIINSIGVQLFSLPKLLEDDFNAGIKIISDIGYNEIEMFGPFPFSINAAKERWNSITPLLGFSGSGYFNHTVQKISAILKEYKMGHEVINEEIFDCSMEEVAKASEELGFEYVVLPAIPEEKRKTLDDYKRVAEEFNEIGEKAKKVGLKFAYHNHGYGLNKTENQTPLKLIFEQTDPNLVFFPNGCLLDYGCRSKPYRLPQFLSRTLYFNACQGYEGIN